MPAPNLNRGVLILLAPNAKDANINQSNSYFVFQYNPEKLLHTFNHGMPQALTGTSEVSGPTVEIFNLTFDLDSLDLEPPNQNQISKDLGIHPSLAILESMMLPQIVGGQTVLPIVIFKWGANRTVPVRVVSMNVEEKTFDQTLNPTRATITLAIKVLSASEVKNSTGARSILTSHQIMQATLADKYRMQTGQGSFAETVSGAEADAIGAGSATNRSSAAKAGSVAKAKSKTKQTALGKPALKTLKR